MKRKDTKMFKGNLAGTIGEIGEYGPFSNKAVKATTVFGIFPANVSGLLEGKHVASFEMTVSSRASRFPKAEKKMAEWCAKNGLNASDYKIIAIQINYSR